MSNGEMRLHLRPLRDSLFFWHSKRMAAQSQDCQHLVIRLFCVTHAGLRLLSTEALL